MNLLREADEAAQRGEKDRANDLRRKAEQMKRDFAERRRGEGPEDEIGQLKEKMMDLDREAREAAERGEKERAEDLRRKMKEIDREIAKRREGRPIQGDELIDQIGKLRKEAIRAKREGRPEDARRVWLEANRMEAEVGREIGMGFEPMRDPSPRPGPGGDMRPGPGPNDDLRREMDRLRREVQELRDLLNRALEGKDKKRGDQPDRERRQPKPKVKGNGDKGDRGDKGEGDEDRDDDEDEGEEAAVI